MSDEIIRFNTEEAIQPKLAHVVPQNIETFKLVSEKDPILKEVLPEFDFENPPVNPNQFASSLVETCKANKGFGLSANQCGFKHRVFVMGAEDNYVAFYNPKVIATRGEAHTAEGCLSFPLLALYVTRPAEIDVEYQDYNGEVRKSTFNGMSARCFLHELDHLNGILYTERCKPLALQQGMKKRSKYTNLIQKAEKNLKVLENHGNYNRVR